MIKHLFTPKHDLFVEADYSQLEIRVLAELSGDETLQRDLLTGKDLHLIRASEWLRKPESEVTPEERRKAKRISFELQYGAGVNSIAKNNGLTKHEAQEFIDSYYGRYPSVKGWQDQVMAEVQGARKPSKERDKGKPIGMSSIRFPYGRGFTFYEKVQERPALTRWGGGSTCSFYPPDVKNYPVQGVATGDVVQMAVGRIARKQLEDWRDGKHWHLVNTVHDSVMVDCSEEDLTHVLDVLHYCMTTMPQYMTRTYGFVWKMPLPVDFKVGTDWSTMKEMPYGNR